MFVGQAEQAHQHANAFDAATCDHLLGPSPGIGADQFDLAKQLGRSLLDA